MEFYRIKRRERARSLSNNLKVFLPPAPELNTFTPVCERRETEPNIGLGVNLLLCTALTPTFGNFEMDNPSPSSSHL